MNDDLRPVAKRVESIEGKVRGLSSTVGAVAGGVRDVQSSVTRLTLKLDSVDLAVAGVHGAVSDLENHQETTLDELRTLHTEFLEYRRRTELARAKQAAQTELIKVRQELDTTYGHYDRVRRSAIGMLQAMDAGLVSDAAVRGLSEELMITTPEYWLAPALVAIGGWLGEDRGLVGRAVTEAARRDPDKAALFFILVLQRHRREAAVARWVERYLAQRDPLALAPEFRIVLDAATTGLLGAAPQVMIADAVRRWATQLGTYPHLAEAQVARWETMLRGLASPAPDLPGLAVHAPAWKRMAELSRRASVFAGGLRFLDDVLVAEAPPDQSLVKRVDALLERLAADFDREEAPFRRQAERLMAIVEYEGDAEAADAARAATRTSDEPVDLASLVSDAALGGADAVAVPAPTRRLAVALSGNWAAEAVRRIGDRLAEAQPQGVHLVHGTWSGILDESTSVEDLALSVREHHDQLTEDAVAAVRLLPRAWLAGVAGVLAVALGVLALVNGFVVLGVIAVVLGLAGSVFASVEHRALPGRRDRAEREGILAAREAEKAIRQAGDEAMLWLDDFERALATAGTLRDRLAAFTP
ncbi:hypothetical protein [Actinomycetospora sp. CA-084318]|uniref:hypothetical protein n=1 Tax=Actinomycetospora sp. CA-084318 TaxID=3239892 RepID=UPI003D952B1B